MRGSNIEGQLGLNHIQTVIQFKKYPIDFLEKGESISQLVTGAYYSMVLTNFGKLLGCGSDLYGQQGTTVNNINEFTLCTVNCLKKDERIIQLAVGDSHTVLLTNFGNVLSAGGNAYGQLGLPDRNQFTFTLCTPVLEEDEKIVQIATGSYHTMLLTNSNKLWVAGFNKYGQLGLAHTKDAKTFTPCSLDVLEEGERIIQVVTGASNSALLTNFHRLFVCGGNSSGQLGLSDKEQRNSFTLCTPGVLEKGEHITKIAIGPLHMMLHTNFGKLLVCGNNHNSQLGLSGFEDRSIFEICPLPPLLLQRPQRKISCEEEKEELTFCSI